MTTNQNDRRWYERGRVVVGLAVISFLFGIGVGGLTDETGDLRLEVEQLAGERDQLESTLALSPSLEEVTQLEKRVDELEDQVEQSRAEAEVAVAELADREDEITRREAALADREGDLEVREHELAVREDELESREDELASREADETQPKTRTAPEGGCQPGQVDINTASVQELQRIYEVGPARAEQIVALRPFSSVDELTRVSGLAEGRLGGIKAQGIACAD